ncbi:MAG: nucleoside hydrolase [Sulfobacillus sp.]
MASYGRDRLPVFLDCDPGIDDAFALMVLLGSPGVELLGISTVGGNVPVELTCENARRILELCGRGQVPVAAGRAQPLEKTLVSAEEVHGRDGLGNINLPSPTVPEAAGGGVGLLIDKLLSVPRAILLATAPLTNVAVALQEHPEIRGHIQRIVWMGGSTGFGNVTPAAEYNAWADPEAARQVIRSGVPFVMVGLNVTHQVALDRSTLAHYRTLGNPVAETAARMLDFYVTFHEQEAGTDRSPIHDAVAAVAAMYPASLRTVSYPVDVETKGEIAEGATVVDLRGMHSDQPRVEVGLEADADFHLQVMADSLASFSAA